MSRVRKFMVALGGAVAIFVDAQADGVFTGFEVEAILIALVSAGFVFLVPNKEAAVEKLDLDEVRDLINALKEGMAEAKDREEELLGLTLDGQPKRSL